MENNYNLEIEKFKKYIFNNITSNIVKDIYIVRQQYIYDKNNYNYYVWDSNENNWIPGNMYFIKSNENA